VIGSHKTLIRRTVALEVLFWGSSALYRAYRFAHPHHEIRI